MVVIVSESKSVRAIKFQEGFLSRFIPCAVTDTACLVELLPALAVISNTESFDVVSAMCRYNNVPFCINIDSFRPGLYSAENSFEMLKNELKKRGTDIMKLDNGRFSMTENRLSFCFRQISLTNREKIIVKLMIFNADRWFGADEVLKYCWTECDRPAKDSVRVHVHNINQKCMNVSGLKLIEAKRYRGYRLIKYN